jgi:hypothetical protein
VRCAIYLRDTVICIYRVPRFTRKTRLSKFYYGTKLWASQNIFPDPIHNIFSKYGHILGKTLCSGPRRHHGRQAHGGTALAPRHNARCPSDFLGLINTSRTSLVRNNERYLAFSPAVPQAFLEVSDLRGRFFRLTFSTGTTDLLRILTLIRYHALRFQDSGGNFVSGTYVRQVILKHRLF